MITHPSTVTVFVRDQDAALAFYTEKLGFEVRSNIPFTETSRWIEVAAPGAQTGIVLDNGFDHFDESRVGGFGRIFWTTDDMQATHATLAERGVQFSQAPVLTPWGMWQAEFLDQDGNSFVLVQMVPAGADAAGSAESSSK